MKPSPSILQITVLTSLLLLAVSGCGWGTSTQTIKLGQGNVITSRGTHTTAILEGVTLQILHPGINHIAAQTFTVSSDPEGSTLNVYKIQIGAHALQLSPAQQGLSLTVNDQPHGVYASGTKLMVDQTGTVRVIEAAPNPSTNAPAVP